MKIRQKLRNSGKSIQEEKVPQFLLVGAVLIGLMFCMSNSATAVQSERIKTSEGDLIITLIGHGTLMFEFGGKTIHVDPWSQVGDYSKLPKADIVLVTHHHGDHLDVAALNQVVKDDTIVVMTTKCVEQIEDMPWSPILMANGDKKLLGGFSVEAVPAYNMVHKRENGQPFHSKGEGNGYIITFGNKRIYVAGDTENTPEMKNLKDIDVAFLPMNLPYTMNSAMAADAAKALKPKALFPYHTRSQEGDQVAAFLELMKGFDGVDIRLLK